MTMTVRGPNGIVVRFPDGTDAATVDRAMREAVSGASAAPVADPAKMAAGPVKTAETSVMGDVAKAVGSGMVTGAEGVLGFPGDVAQLAHDAGGWVGRGIRSAVGMPPKAPDAPSLANPLPLPTSADIASANKAVTGFEPYQPTTTAGEFARTAAEFVPSAVTLGGVAKAVPWGVIPGLASEGAGQLTEGSQLEPYARIGGAIAGGMAWPMIRRAITPFPSSPERAAMVDALRREGVTDLTAGQMTGSNKLRYMESELGGVRGAQMADDVGEQFTAAALRRAGINANRATPEVIDDAFTRIGGEFDRLAAGNSMRLDAPTFRRVIDAIDNYEALVPPSMQTPAVRRIADDLFGAIQTASNQGGTAILGGAAYQNIRSMLGKQAQSLRISNPQAAEALRDIQGVLDDAMEAGIAAVNPRDLGAWRTARREYQAMLVLEKAATGAGENAAMGLISPSALRNATVSTTGRRNFARGRGDFADLARAGEAVMKPLPQSGTAPRTAARNLVASVPTLLGAGAGSAAMGGVEGGLLGAMVGGALPGATGRAMLSNVGRAYLSNRALGPTQQRAREAIVAELLGLSVPARLGVESR